MAGYVLRFYECNTICTFITSFRENEVRPFTTIVEAVDLLLKQSNNLDHQFRKNGPWLEMHNGQLFDHIDGHRTYEAYKIMGEFNNIDEVIETLYTGASVSFGKYDKSTFLNIRVVYLDEDRVAAVNNANIHGIPMEGALEWDEFCDEDDEDIALRGEALQFWQAKQAWSDYVRV
jgi:hypothetical protein